ncbi:MAG: hypothetical protein J0I77_20235 [Rudaea sp.]|uniref:hypothetical protein n=1 Tax=unclassified Rudaea TaxID=2627037 RepID=UPI0010F76501|nr:MULTISPECIES: hypothetical protein [unclassified Rudaea]MBN8888053.1 hypothetical protein [Rudaea sp.]MBR0343819.1 hypothetical protein [Rudaea sp.]
MKRNLGTFFFGAAASLCAPAAMAMYLNPYGAGQVLVYPYYTVNGGYATFFAVFNTTNQGKAIKVRLLEGYNGRDVQDFNLYLSPDDYWVGAVVDSGNGGAAIFTNDNSCTVPKLPRTSATALALTTANFDGSAMQGKDGGPTDVSRTREGHIEIIEMGTVTGPSATLNAITHVEGVPADCASAVNAWAAGGQWVADSTKDIGPPTGGLVGNGMVLNVANGTVFSYGADAIAQFYVKDGRGEHSRPDALTPNVSNATSLSADVMTDAGRLTLAFARPIDAVSAVFMANEIHNEYWTSNSVAAASEWVITYPTKRFYVDPYYINGAVRPPFELAFSKALGGTSGSAIRAAIFDREEGQNTPEIVTLPPVWGKGLFYETQVATFGQQQSASQIVASRLVTANFQIPDAENGWAKFDLAMPEATTHRLAAVNGNVLIGQPVTGFWINQLINGDAGGKGVLANYTSLYRHKLHAACLSADGTPCS